MRYLPHNDEAISRMLSEIGVSEVDELFSDVPSKALKNVKFNLPNHMSELEVERYMKNLTKNNLVASEIPFFIGGGAYQHHIPSAVDHIIQRGEFLTSYTPYQAEISQGTLQSLYEFQTQVSMITGMEIANASMYDGSTASAEAVLMAGRITKKNKIVITEAVHPQWIETIKTFINPIGMKLLKIKKKEPGKFEDNFGEICGNIDKDTACVVIQIPDFFGSVGNYIDISKKCNEYGALLIVCVTEVLSLGLLNPPGKFGADIVVCEGQSLGVGLSFGGPYVGLFSTHKKYVRYMPGRIVGQTSDKNGKRGWVLTLNTREQHIRREKATSNICTNAGLCALAFSIHLSLLGETGFKKLAVVNHERANFLYDALLLVKNISLLNDSFFNEFVISLPSSSKDFVEHACRKGVMAGLPVERLFFSLPNSKNMLLIAATELNTDNDIKKLVKLFKDYF